MRPLDLYNIGELIHCRQKPGLELVVKSDFNR
jgi:hypothetical protein